MNQEIYSIIYACYFELFGRNLEYEYAMHEKQEQYAKEMLEKIFKELKKEGKE